MHTKTFMEEGERKKTPPIKNINHELIEYDISYLSSHARHRRRRRRACDCIIL